jgi:hypothetical protein
MLVALPAYQFAVLPAINPDAGAVKMGFSHAYYGATRHAITVGFVSLMIVGVAAKVVPVLRGADARRLTGLWVPFVLRRPGWAEVRGVRPTGPVTGGDYVADVLDRSPALLPVFLRFGFRPLASPVLRRTAARGVTIDLACRMIGADKAAFLAALNAALPGPKTVSLTVVRPVSDHD